ncbi:tetratricopeptide repeat protein [Pedobacter sp. SD-b]|uniref:Tetratricopeptide repeat protein n=1 Tax=Pedobacter segetis TaxID=2793069 RepID=A0ABS1BNX1_9SPHI|nr:tetratricopeptide repeat protein [Pedobacter segetis]MBK0384518.1 tetratricopeptide repeat protein [Pedobacter segetis]
MKLNFITNLFKKKLVEDTHKTTNGTEPIRTLQKGHSKDFIESGKLNMNKKKYNDALDDFTTAIELDPESITAYLERSQAKKQLNDKIGADKDMAKGRRLLENLDNGLKANDDGNIAYDEGDYKNAIKFYNKAIPLIPTITTIYYYRGYSKQCLGDYEGALEDYNYSIDLCASNRDLSYYLRSKIKSRKHNDKTGALQDLNKAIELNPDDSDYYYSRAILVDDYDALQDLNKAVELSPNDADNYVARSLRKKAMEDLESSISDLTKYIELNPKNSLLTVCEAYTLRAGMRMFQNNLEASLLDHNKAVEVDSLSEKAISDRGIVKDLLKDYEGAISDFDKAIKLNPKYADAYYHRGIVKQTIGLEDEGLVDIIHAKSLGFVE